MKKLLPLLFLVFGLTACDGQTIPPAQVGSAVSSVFAGDTKVYVDEQHGFSFTYPADWRQIGTGDSSAKFMPMTATDTVPVSLTVWSGPNISHSAESLGEVCAKTTVQIAGQNVEKVTNCGLINLDTGEEVQKEFRLISLDFVHDDNEYSLEFSMENSSVYHYEQEVFDQVIASFRFTK
jgi:hypothetical protein